MTHQEAIDIYKAAYKEARDFREEYTRHAMKPFVGLDDAWGYLKYRFTPNRPSEPATPPKPPSPVYPKVNRTVENGMSQAQNHRSWDESLQGSVRPTPTWTAPTENSLATNAENGFGYNARLEAQNDAMEGMNAAIRAGVSPRVRNAYGEGYVNMSREAMLRRINAIRAQQEKDKALLKAQPSQVVAR